MNFFIKVVQKIAKSHRTRQCCHCLVFLITIATQCLQQQNRHHYANYIQFPDDTCQSYFHKLYNKTMDLF